MSSDNVDVWDKDFLSKAEYFRELKMFSKTLNQNSWPKIDWFNEVASSLGLEPPRNHLGQTLTFVSDNLSAPLSSNLNQIKPMSYEESIFHQAIINTRTQNWHDLFNHLTWLLWPNLKATLNAIYVIQNTKRLPHQSRSASQHFVAQFDECGIIICIAKSCDFMREAILEHHWSELFLSNKDHFNKNIECFILGHALFEKGLNPYIGLTAKAKIVIVEEDFFNLSLEAKRKILDKQLSNEFWVTNLTVNSLSPFPMLGVPGWFTNQDESFYQNQQYFRGKSAKLIALP